MIDKEKVIKGLEICSEYGSWHGLDCEDNEAYKDCPYRGCQTGCIVTIAKDAIVLLKEQEELNDHCQSLVIAYNDMRKEQKAIKPVKQIEQTEWTVCGCCGKHIISKWTFCPYCGRMVDWDA